ncbi:methionine biosynthesis protein MetW-like protein [Leptospira fainei serovar Hurstbridge str. BUT 6]|uniref:Methionine biosynthesis protein MetW-like protein n=2 Tax=Leptospira fainei TaxID=48782 RepID=S3UQ84_9LEPT|nr:methionine biosynthesis protein MetW-like protein [Leptospira fainei serovar Hurstbridge str. BUT 6]
MGKTREMFDLQSLNTSPLTEKGLVDFPVQPDFQYSANSPSKEILAALKAVSDETRIRLLLILSIAPLNVQEVTEVLAMGQSRVSRHLKILADAGFLDFQREGSWVYYKVKDPTVENNFQIRIFNILMSHERDLPYSVRDIEKAKEILKQRDLKTTRYFDFVAKDWENLQQDVLDPLLYRKKILQLLPDSLCRTFDLGCGPGGLIPYLLTKSQEVIGIDSSESMIREASLTFLNNPKVNFIAADLEMLPRELAKSSDAVVASMVLHHISNPPKAMKEVHRVLKDGGTFLIVDLKKHNQEFMRDNFADLWLGFEPELLSDWLEDSGFIVESVQEIESQKYFKVLIIKAKKKGGL